MKLLEQYGLSKQIIKKFEQYAKLLLEWNEKFNLTAIKNIDEIEEKHFIDSLYMDKYVELNNQRLLEYIHDQRRSKYALY